MSPRDRTATQAVALVAFVTVALSAWAASTATAVGAVRTLPSSRPRSCSGCSSPASCRWLRRRNG